MELFPEVRCRPMMNIVLITDPAPLPRSCTHHPCLKSRDVRMTNDIVSIPNHNFPKVSRPWCQHSTIIGNQVLFSGNFARIPDIALFCCNFHGVQSDKDSVSHLFCSCRAVVQSPGQPRTWRIDP